MIQNMPCSIFCSQMISGWLSPAGNTPWITLSVKLNPVFSTVNNFHLGGWPLQCLYNIITNKWTLLLTHKFTYIYISYICIGGCHHVIGWCQHVIGCYHHNIRCWQHPTNIMCVLCPTISVNISLYQDIWCFTRDLTCVSTCLPNCALFAQSGCLFRYSARYGYLPPAGYVL